MSNGEALPLARKDFELNAEDKAYEKERDVLREIVRNAKKHTNIMKSLGSLEIGSTYSIFMPLADCDLKQHMERNPSKPGSPAQKAEFVECAVGLAGAIVYLHEELESPLYEKLSCFHMDLKPQNILVVTDPRTKEQQWKLSDFNMSRVKMKPKHNDEQLSLRRTLTFGDNVYDINKLFKRRNVDASDPSIADYTINRRGAGTYLSPESCVEDHPVQAESDIWSLGCVISVIFSYLYGGQAAVEDFAKLRLEQGMDRFFTFSAGNDTQRLTNAQISDAVKRWHKQLRLKTRQESAMEGAIFEDMLKFLARKVLIIDPKQRRHTKAEEVRVHLIEAFKGFRGMASITPVSPKNAKFRFRLLDLAKFTHRRQSEATARPQDWDITESSTVRTCVFGPNAQPLVSVTDRTLTAYSLEHALLTSGSDDFEEDLMIYGQAVPMEKGRLWNPIVGVTSHYVLAATDHHEFDVRTPHALQ